jgi:cytochrome b pre-mRNA-processing protein 3
MFNNIFSFSDTKKSAHRLYIILVEQARQPTFYENCGVDDTVAGRFDMVVLHAILVLRRLHREGDDSKELSQALFDYMFDDFDLNLREIGIGDTGIGMRIKKMGTGFYGRMAVYNEGLDSDDDQLLSAALARNLYREMEPTAANLTQMAQYMRHESKGLEGLDIETVIKGAFHFGPPPPGQG